MTTLTEAINELPSTAVGVLDYLKEREVTGLRDDAEHCPLAEWLTEQVGVQVSVAMNMAWTWEAHEQSVDLPTHLLEFITAFDTSTLPGGEALLV